MTQLLHYGFSGDRNQCTINCFAISEHQNGIRAQTFALLDANKAKETEIKGGLAHLKSTVTACKLKFLGY